jgi:hypothetical protein
VAEDLISVHTPSVCRSVLFSMMRRITNLDQAEAPGYACMEPCVSRDDCWFGYTFEWNGGFSARFWRGIYNNPLSSLGCEPRNGIGPDLVYIRSVCETVPFPRSFRTTGLSKRLHQNTEWSLEGRALLEAPISSLFLDWWRLARGQRRGWLLKKMAGLPATSNS